MMKVMTSLVKVFIFAVLLHKAWQLCNTSDLLCGRMCHPCHLSCGQVPFKHQTDWQNTLLLQCTAALTLAAAHNLEYLDYLILSITVMGITQGLMFAKCLRHCPDGLEDASSESHAIHRHGHLSKSASV